ncbi:MAG: amidohydrolase family protein [Firmicutes bacterium]|nr:amidohydrolase family protein [Bacillota bacterium]
MLDLVIENGTLVIPRSGLVRGNVGISGGKIVALTDPIVNLTAREKIDAAGRFVFPGVVEPHSHIGIGAGEQDLVTETRSALFGGVTTILFFLREPTPYDETFEQVKAAAEQSSYTDFGFHIVLLTDEHLAAVPKYVREWGATSFKLYMTYRGEEAMTTGFGGKPFNCPSLTDGFLLDALEKVAKFPEALAIAHCENIEIVNRIKACLVAQQRDDMEAWAQSRPPVAEAEAIRRISFLARHTGARLNILHLTSRAGLDAVREAKTSWKGISVEVCHPYLAVGSCVILNPEAKLRPPIRGKQDAEALWEGVKDGTVDSIGSDHVPRKLQAKMGSVWKPAAGAPGSPFLLPVMLTEGHFKRDLPLQRVAELTSYNAAVLYGLHPRKGDIRVGSDADLVIVDLDREATLSVKDYDMFSDYILYEGMKVRGVPTATIVRGVVAMRDGRVLEKRHTAEYLHRG